MTEASNLNGDLGMVFSEIDLYSHFKEQGYCRPYKFDIDLFPYYDVYEGSGKSNSCMILFDPAQVCHEKGAPRRTPPVR